MDTIYSATLAPKEERRLLRGHDWVYRNEFKKLPEMPDGAVVDVFSSQRRFIGRGFFQQEGGIGVRLMARRQSDINRDFLAKKLAEAKALRERLFPQSQVYRWVHAESDGLPGLVVDRYDRLVMVQSSCLFYQEHQAMLAEILLDHEGVEGVIIRVQAKTENYGVVEENYDLIIDDLKLSLAPLSSQKTGLFLDQRSNSQAATVFAPDMRVLDGHCYHGWWGCRFAMAGATLVRGVDSSEAAIEQATINAQRNGVADQCRFECNEVESVLEEEGRYDVVLIDPPAYAKGRRHTKIALKRYQELNTTAMNAVEPGGILISSSCSHFVSPEAFRDMLKQAAAGAKVKAKLLEFRGASADHPVHLSMPETAYLKCAFVQIRR